MSVLKRESVEKQYAYAISDRRPNEICITYIHRLHGFSWFNKTIMNKQMKLWRKDAKENKIKMGLYNNKTTKDEQNNTWYILVVQEYCDGEMEECNFDPMGLFIMGEMVSGFMYAFQSESNRDAVYNYVMKDIEQPPK
jgi:hypothetical protein